MYQHICIYKNSKVDSGVESENQERRGSRKKGTWDRDQAFTKDEKYVGMGQEQLLTKERRRRRIAHTSPQMTIRRYAAYERGHTPHPGGLIKC